MIATLPLTRSLWAEIEPTFEGILAHPFLRGIGDGTLPVSRFRFFVLQDAVYLQTYARALSALGGRAPTVADTEFFATRAGKAIAVERALHETLLRELGLDRDAVRTTEPSPTTLAYTSFILASVHGGSFMDGLSSVLPCYWIYLEVGKELGRRGSPNPLFQRWVDTYGSADFETAVTSVLALADRLGQRLGVDERDRCRDRFVQASRYEWMFWDAAWREEGWPIGSTITP